MIRMWLLSLTNDDRQRILCARGQTIKFASHFVTYIIKLFNAITVTHNLTHFQASKHVARGHMHPPAFP